jgi:hypothetical protein
MSNCRIVRRLNGELGKDNYTIDEYNEFDTPTRLTFKYRKTAITIHIGSSYPFHPPKSIGDWDHPKYKRLPDYYREYTGQDWCPYCEIMDEWVPGSRLDSTIERFIKLDTSISNCIKVNVLFRNVLCLPEDLIPLILSYLEGMGGLSCRFRACAY